MVLAPTHMSKVMITGPKTLQKPVIEELHKARVLHIVEHKPKDSIDIGTPLEQSEYLSEILVRIRSIAANLNIDRKAKTKNYQLKNGYKSLDVISTNLLKKVNENLEQLKEAESLIDKNNQKLKILKELQTINTDPDALKDFKSISCFIGYVKKAEPITNEIKKISQTFELKTSNTKNNLLLLAVPKKHHQPTLEILKKHEFSELDISTIKELKGTTEENIKKIEDHNETINRKQKTIELNIEQLRLEWEPYLIWSENYILKELEKLQAPLKFASTKNIFLINGWVPTKKVKRLETNLKKTTQEKIHISTEPIKKGDNIPVKLDNPKSAQPFEFFMDLYSYPRYKEIDPTLFMFIGFPIFFGFILGDFGYGIVTLLISLAFMKMMPKAKNFFKVFMWASIYTIFFGFFIFGEFFGAEDVAGIHIPDLSPLFIASRGHDLPVIMNLALIIGIFHVVFGFLAGFYNVMKDHGIKHAIYEKLSWILLVPLLIEFLLFTELFSGAVAQFFHWLLPSLMVNLILGVIGLILMLKGEGPIAIIELPALLGNTLSYLRLMAIGLASVIFAMIINQFAFDFIGQGGFMIVAGLLIMIFGHILNIAIGMLEGFLHSMRLHYVEFFSKFFKGGAKQFKPFGN